MFKSSMDRPRPSLGRLTSGFRMYPRVLSARAEAHEKTRVQTPIVSTNAVRIVFARAGELLTFKPSMDRLRPSLGRLTSGFCVYPRVLSARAEAHEKTRVQTPIVSTNAVRIVFARAEAAEEDSRRAGGLQHLRGLSFQQCRATAAAFCCSHQSH